MATTTQASAATTAMSRRGLSSVATIKTTIGALDSNTPRQPPTASANENASASALAHGEGVDVMA
nr:hypothetical protein [Nanchangia anserum]